MKKFNSSLVTGELFLDLEAAIHGKTSPTLQTIFSLNEILELLVFKDNLFMTSSDHILILKNLNKAEIAKLGGNEQIDWAYELRNLGSANLLKPIITNHLLESGILTLDTGQDEDSEFKDFGQKIYERQWSGDWLLKTIGFGTDSLEQKGSHEVSFLKGFNDTIDKVSSDPQYWEMAIKAAPFLAEDFRKQYGYDHLWVHKYYEEVAIYLDFAKKRNYDFNDSPFMQPFIALQAKPSELFSKLFYEELRNTRNEDIKTLLEIEEPYILFLPPLTTILLQRCNKLEDLPVEMLKLRNEFQNIRESFSNFQREFNEAKLIREKMGLKKDFLRSVELFRSKVKSPKRRIIKTLLDFTVEHASNALISDYSGSIASIAKKIAEHIYARKIYPWVYSFADLYEKSLDIDVNSKPLEKLFGEMGGSHLDDYKLFGKNSASLVRRSGALRT